MHELQKQFDQALAIYNQLLPFIVERKNEIKKEIEKEEKEKEQKEKEKLE